MKLPQLPSSAIAGNIWSRIWTELKTASHSDPQDESNGAINAVS